MPLNPVKIKATIAAFLLGSFIAFVSFTIKSDLHSDRFQYELETESVSRGLYLACLQSHGTNWETVANESSERCHNRADAWATETCRSGHDLFGNCQRRLYDIEFANCQRTALPACRNAGSLWDEPGTFPIVLRHQWLHFFLGPASFHLWLAVCFLVISLAILRWGSDGLRRLTR